MTVLEFFKTNKWCQGGMARTPEGEVCGSQNPAAVEFSIQGGIDRALGWTTPEGVAATRTLCLVIDPDYRKGTEVLVLHQYENSPDATKEAMLAILERAGI